jgi:hypothetical protein
MDFVPIKSVFLVLVVKKTILCVDDFPQGFEISLRGVVRYILGNTGRQ